jgi:hypothetical protein
MISSVVSTSKRAANKAYNVATYPFRKASRKLGLSQRRKSRRKSRKSSRKSSGKSSRKGKGVWGKLFTSAIKKPVGHEFSYKGRRYRVLESKAIPGGKNIKRIN